MNTTATEPGKEFNVDVLTGMLQLVGDFEPPERTYYIQAAGHSAGFLTFTIPPTWQWDPETIKFPPNSLICDPSAKYQFESFVGRDTKNNSNQPNALGLPTVFGGINIYCENEETRSAIAWRLSRILGAIDTHSP